MLDNVDINNPETKEQIEKLKERLLKSHQEQLNDKGCTLEEVKEEMADRLTKL